VRHARSGKKLGRDSAHRKALYSNLAGALIEHGRIKTTVTKAKAVKPIAEQMITLGRRGDLHARRQATAFLRSRDVVHKLFAEVAPRFKDRPGGYARIIRIGPRAGDAAEMAYLELVDEEYVEQQREERTPAPPAVVAEEPEAEESAEESSDPGADESADDGDHEAGEADEPEGLGEAGAEEAPADPGKSD
jgi:large subunit ribosomal protein L17